MSTTGSDDDGPTEWVVMVKTSKSNWLSASTRNSIN
jgi:hypothetical protein